jgi:hypothetical protein
VTVAAKAVTLLCMLAQGLLGIKEETPDPKGRPCAKQGASTLQGGGGGGGD